MLSWSNYGHIILKILFCFLCIKTNIFNTDPLIISASVFEHLLLQPLYYAETALKELIAECEKQKIYTSMVAITRYIKVKATEKRELKV